jgi:hypothetical protein
MEIDRNLFGETHVNGLWREQSFVIGEAPLHDRADVATGFE